jgi:hypothetical protein
MQQATNQPIESRLIVMVVYPGFMTMDVMTMDVVPHESM